MRRPGPGSDEKSGFYAKQTAELAGWIGADRSVPAQRFIHVAALTKDGEQIARGLPRMLKQKPQPLPRRAVVRRQGVPAIVVAN